jgi:hypothetical protein
MSKLAQYCVIDFRPNFERKEVVSIGLLVRFENEWDIRLLPDASKVSALNPLFPIGGITAVGVTLTRMLERADSFQAARILLTQLGGSPGLQDFVGQFPSDSDQQYENEIAWLMSELVSPPLPTLSASTRLISEPRLRTKLRNHFKSQHILARSKDQINDHKVVENFPIEAGKGLIAEFALKNSCMHITETVDFDVALSSNRNKRLEAQAKTLVLSAAKDRLGPTTKTYVIVAGSNRNVAKTSINLLGDYAEVFALESADDMNSYFQRIYSAANSNQNLLSSH